MMKTFSFLAEICFYKRELPLHILSSGHWFESDQWCCWSGCSSVEIHVDLGALCICLSLFQKWRSCYFCGPEEGVLNLEEKSSVICWPAGVRKGVGAVRDFFRSLMISFVLLTFRDIYLDILKIFLCVYSRGSRETEPGEISRFTFCTLKLSWRHHSRLIISQFYVFFILSFWLTKAQHHSGWNIHWAELLSRLKCADVYCIYCIVLFTLKEKVDIYFREREDLYFDLSSFHVCSHSKSLHSHWSLPSVHVSWTTKTSDANMIQWWGIVFNVFLFCSHNTVKKMFGCFNLWLGEVWTQQNSTTGFKSPRKCPYLTNHWFKQPIILQGLKHK